MAGFANGLAALMQAAQGGGALLPSINGPANPQAAAQAAMTQAMPQGPMPSLNAAPQGIPPGWQAALAQMQARLAQGGGIPQPNLTAGQLPTAALSPQALQAAGGILAGRRPVIR